MSKASRVDRKDIAYQQSRLREGFSNFFHKETSGALVMLAATIAALILANTQLYSVADHLLHLELGVTSGAWEFAQSYKHWIDDALMAVFFFVVGLEIKREFIVGELSTLKGAALPVVAALGGMVVPAVLYSVFNSGGEGAHGWGIPMATDIAFALGVLALLSSRIPTSLKVFLTALAIADDIGAILVIAFFYTSSVAWGWLVFALVPLGIMIALNKAKIDPAWPYLVCATVLWFAFLNSGIHATLAGVIAAFTIPTTARLHPVDFADYARRKADHICEIDNPNVCVIADDDQQLIAFQVADAARKTASPLQRLEHAFLPLSTFIILPLFALANAEIRLVGHDLTFDAVGWGIFAGLLIGKPLGIVGLSWLGIKLRLLSLPEGLTMKHLVGAGLLAGIGFTMSIFVSNLAFRGAHAVELESEAKLAILVTSVIAGLVGYLWLRFVAPAARSAE